MKQGIQTNEATKQSARHRSGLSRPALWLFQNNLLSPKILDYGCGRGDDVRFLNEAGILAEGYDPHFGPQWKELEHDYTTILCTYVLNVVHPDNRRDVVEHMWSLCCPNTQLFITVRRDLEWDEVDTGRGYSQYNVVLPKEEFEIVKETSRYCIYKLRK